MVAVVLVDELGPMVEEVLVVPELETSRTRSVEELEELVVVLVVVLGDVWEC